MSAMKIARKHTARLSATRKTELFKNSFFHKRLEFDKYEPGFNRMQRPFRREIEPN